MGCDIHIALEYLDPTTKELKLDKREDLRVIRNYNLFALLSGVRSWFKETLPLARSVTLYNGVFLSEHDTPPIWREEPGFHPQIEHWEWDGCHSFGIITSKEIEEYPWDLEFEYNDVWDDYVKEGKLTKKIKTWDILPQPWKKLFAQLKFIPQARIVIWYDN